MSRAKNLPAGERSLPAGLQCLYFLAHGWLAGLLAPVGFGLWRGSAWAGVALAFALNSFLCALFYRGDKILAERGLWRIPERCLHMWELFGGWPGAVYAWRKYRHKSRKGSFLAVSALCILLDLALVAWLIARTGGPFRTIR